MIAAKNKKCVLKDFERLAYPLMDYLYSVAVNLTRNPTEAEDLLQDTYLRAWKGFSSFKPDSNFRAWIFRILTNTFINRYNSFKRRPRQADFEVAVATLTEQPQLLGRNIMDLDGDLRNCFDDDVNAALDRLPDHYRTALLLAEINDMTYREIADTLGCPIGTVMSRISRGRNMMAKSLEKYASSHGYLVPA